MQGDLAPVSDRRCPAGEAPADFLGPVASTPAAMCLVRGESLATIRDGGGCGLAAAMREKAGAALGPPPNNRGRSWIKRGVMSLFPKPSGAEALHIYTPSFLEKCELQTGLLNRRAGPLGRSAPRGERAHGSVSGAQRPVRRGIRAGRTDETENRSEVRPPP